MVDLSPTLRFLPAEPVIVMFALQLAQVPQKSFVELFLKWQQEVVLLTW